MKSDAEIIVEKNRLVSKLGINVKDITQAEELCLILGRWAMIQNLNMDKIHEIIVASFFTVGATVDLTLACRLYLSGTRRIFCSGDDI